jgi:hypothetical protein
MTMACVNKNCKGQNEPNKNSFNEDNDQGHDQEDEGEVGDESVDGGGRANLLHPVHVEFRIDL